MLHVDKATRYLEYLCINQEKKNDVIFYSLDVEKLAKVLENDDNFKNIDDGLAKLDSFLN